MFKSHLASASPEALTTDSPEFLNVLGESLTIRMVVVALTGPCSLHKPKSKVSHVLWEVNIVNHRDEGTMKRMDAFKK